MLAIITNVAVLLLQQLFIITGQLKNKKMSAEEYFRMTKEGRRLENEYFIAMDKASFFQLMEEYASYKKNRAATKPVDRSIITKVTTTKVKEYI